MDDVICQAIAGRHVVAFRSYGQRRVGEPHVYGLAKGKPTLLLYQTGGSSMNGPYPIWRRCELEGVTRFTLTGRTFQGARLSSASARDDWDEVWAIVT